MSRLPGKVLGPLAALALIAHGVALAPVLGGGTGPSALVTLGVLLAVTLGGRVLLAFFPPGEVGGHDLRALPATAAASLALAVLAATALHGLVGWRTALALVLVLLVVRGLTLPGAMVPRHALAHERWRAMDGVAAVLCGLWGVVLLGSEAPEALLWGALFVLVFHALGCARRARAGRWAVLALGLGCALAIQGGNGVFPVFGLGTGACFLVPWLRRADRRAGALAALGFGSLFVVGLDPLALAGALVFVLASHPRQRRFALASVALFGGLALARAWLWPHAIENPPDFLAAHRRWLWGWVLGDLALEREVWGLAWPIVAGALLLGLLTFPWRAPAWTSGTVEEPRRETLALLALLGLSLLAVALPWSNWFEQDALRTLFPLCALLAGLLLIPPERVAPDA